MPGRRALVDCAVLSLQDACVFYPCCKGCFSRIDAEPQDPTRLSCSKCGFSCPRGQVDYRYRLSVKVARDTCIFGVTVFGACLNPFFGIHASGLQRLAGDLNGPVEASARSTLLLKAVQDCFIGRHFIFGIKLTETENGCWLEGSKVSRSNNMVQFIASQMILPKVRGLEGCTVISYYQTLVQTAAENELGSTDPTRTSRPSATPLLLTPHRSSNSSFSNTTLCASGFLSQSLQRSHQQDCMLSPTPPWQQSLGLVTSSAEQEESRATQDNGDECSRIIHDLKTPHREQSGSAQNSTEERLLSCPMSLQSSSSDSPTSSKYRYSSVEKSVADTPVLSPWLSPSPSGHTMVLPPPQTILTSSLALEDLPFSESLTEFLCKENKCSERVFETETHLNVQNPKESRTFLNITNTAAVNNGVERHDLSDVACNDSVECVNTSQASDVYPHDCNEQDEKTDSEINEEQLAGSVYNCSADLFSSSLNMDTTSKIHDAEASSLLCQPDKQYLRVEKADVTPPTPDKPQLRRSKCNARDSFGTQDYLQSLEFIPPSQSTPIVKVALISGSRGSTDRTLALDGCSPDRPDLCALYGNCAKVDSEKTPKITPSACKVNCVSSKQLESLKENVVCGTTRCRHSNRFTPKRCFRKSDKHKSHLLARQQLRVQRGARNTGSTGRTNHKCDSDVCDVAEDNEMIVPPTPAAKTHLNVKLQRRRRVNTSKFTWGAQEAGGKDCKITLLEQTVTTQKDHVRIESSICPQRDGVMAEYDRLTTADGANLDGFNCDFLGDENEACNWSRDLFSD